jgi:hypothetical protein
VLGFVQGARVEPAQPELMIIISFLGVAIISEDRGDKVQNRWK